jgi:6-phosphogluconolactonase/glucosamine-6-phosphate isomerase/deaminase
LLPNFVRLRESTGPVVDYIYDCIAPRLESGQSVFWLVPGGSAIKVAAQVATKLGDSDLSRLTVSLTDERYGEVGHPDSNWQQLSNSGFTLSGANLAPVLIGKNMAETVTEFSNFLGRQLALSDYSIGLFGLGKDGHTAGILPGSVAVLSEDLAAGYDTEEYRRVTMTPKSIEQLDEAVVFAVGQDKHSALDDLAKDLSITQQPAQVLKKVNKLSIFNDKLGKDEE